jgi:ABC-type Fe3+/spermidine/putrescine transport system ATPase subunit
MTVVPPRSVEPVEETAPGLPTSGDRPSGPPALEILGLRVAYDRRPVLDGLELVVGPGQTVAILGPSGAGKSTLLAAIAGFVTPSAGEIRIAQRTVFGRSTFLAPEERRVGVVFQSYALWPHMSALDTVSFPLRRGGVAPGEANRRARDLLERLGIGHLAARRPAEMSGGEQQRVGVARALAREPDLYLLDEPTAHLDATLRAVLQEELAEHRRRDGTAALYATHDVAEALAVADRVALLRTGRIVQVGTPIEVYERPSSAWAARLTGPASILRGAGLPQADGVAVAEATSSIVVRPEWATLGGERDATVRATFYRGSHTDYRLATGFGDLVVRHAGPAQLRAGDATTWGLLRAWALPDGAEEPL